MKARDLFERAAAPAPVEAPPKPGTKPDAPSRPAPTKHPNPFRRRNPGKDPGPMPKPKACVEAKKLFKRGCEATGTCGSCGAKCSEDALNTHRDCQKCARKNTPPGKEVKESNARQLFNR